ncbi:MAG: transposase [Candidatus Methylomirabilis oxygeniifera]|nr:MAG: transposase [Candidatus Methylomirabilis oxyfera]
MGRKTPGEVYGASPRPYPGILPPVEYESGVTVRQVRHNGEIKWRGARIYVSDVLAHEPVGLTLIDEDAWEVRYSFHVLGVLEQRLKKIMPATGWHGAEQVNV